MYDVVIIGAGPAGATLARLICRKYKVLIIERRTFQNPLYGSHQKCCGGLLDPDAQKMLASFGLGLPGSVIISPQMFSVRTIDFDNELERYYQRHYVNVDREEFDKWMVSLIPSRVHVELGSFYHSHRVFDDHVEINYSRNGKMLHIVSKTVVGADGAYSFVRRRTYSEEKTPKVYIAIQEWFENTERINYYGAIFAKDVTDFYSWLIPKDNYLIIGAALRPRVSPHDKFSLLKEKLKTRGFLLSKSIRKNGTHLLRPGSIAQINTGTGRVALVGEAAGFISPSSAEGFSYAFRSAHILAESLIQDLESWDKIYKKKSIKLKRNILFKLLKSPGMYNKILRKVVMKTGLRSIKVKYPG